MIIIMWLIKKLIKKYNFRKGFGIKISFTKNLGSR